MSRKHSDRAQAGYRAANPAFHGPNEPNAPNADLALALPPHIMDVGILGIVTRTATIVTRHVVRSLGSGLVRSLGSGHLRGSTADWGQRKIVKQWQHKTANQWGRSRTLTLWKAKTAEGTLLNEVTFGSENPPDVTSVHGNWNLDTDEHQNVRSVKIQFHHKGIHALARWHTFIPVEHTDGFVCQKPGVHEVQWAQFLWPYKAQVEQRHAEKFLSTEQRMFNVGQLASSGSKELNDADESSEEEEWSC